MIRIYLFFTYKNHDTFVGTFTSDQAAIETAKRINAVALFIEKDVFNQIPAPVSVEGADYTREFLTSRWQEIEIK